MSIFLSYITFVISFMAVGCIVLYALEKLKNENAEALRRNYEKEYGDNTIFF